ncbi:unnamed protein product, partial [Polarella glacialis]
MAFSEQECQELKRVVGLGSLAEVRALVGPQHVGWHQGGQSLLFWAVLRKPPPPATTSTDGRQEGEEDSETLDICRYLVEEVGLDPDRVSEKRQVSPLFCAAMAGQSEVLRYLLEKKADPRRLDILRQTPLFFVFGSGGKSVARRSCVELLLAAGVDVRHKDNRKQTALFWASSAHHDIEPVKILVAAIRAANESGEDLMVDELKQTPLFYAVKASSVAVCQLLIDARCGVDDKDTTQQVPLYFAARAGRADCAKLLLDLGAAVDSRDSHTETPLFYAVEFKHVDVCRVLLGANADPLARNATGWTPAGKAIAGEEPTPPRPQELKDIFKASWDARRPALPPALQRPVVASLSSLRASAAPGGSDALSEVGSRRSVRRVNSNSSAMTPTKRQRRQQGGVQDDDMMSDVSAAVAALPPLKQGLDQVQVPGDACLDELQRAVLRGSASEARRLLDIPAAPWKLRDVEYARSLLELAAMRPDGLDASAAELCQALVQEHGVKPSDGNVGTATCKTPWGTEPLSPLFHAVRLEMPRCAAILLEARCDVGLQDANGRTALFHAACLESSSCTALLLDAAADANVVDAKGRTPLMEAAHRGFTAPLELLLRRGARLDLTPESFDKVLMTASARCVGLLATMKGLQGSGGSSSSTAPGEPGVPAESTEGPATLGGGPPFLRPLVMAAEDGDELKVKALLQASADVGARDALTGRTVLHAAVRCKQLQVCKALLSFKADHLVEDASGATPKSLASEMKWTSVLTLFNQQENQNRVYFAEHMKGLSNLAQNGSLKQLRDLILSPAIGGAEVLSPLHAAAGRLHGDGQTQEAPGAVALEACRCLVEDGNLPVDTLDTLGRTPIFEAVEAGNAMVCEYLVQKRCDVESPAQDGRTALFSALGARGQRPKAPAQPRLVQVLLELRANVNRADTYLRQTPLFFAAVSGNRECVDLLLAASADVDVADNSGQRPLDYGAGAQDGEGVVESLLQAKASVNKEDNSGRPPLFWAIKSGREASALLLLENGAWPVPPSGNSSSTMQAHLGGGKKSTTLTAAATGKSLVELARDRDLKEVVAILQKRDQLRDTLLHAARSGSPEELEAAVAEGAGVQAVVDKDRKSALHLAAARQDPLGVPCCRQLLEVYGVDPNVQDKQGRTALFQAAAHGSEECVALLVESRCNPELTDNDGETAIFAAARSGRSDTCAALLALGARAAHRSSERSAHQMAAICAVVAGSEQVLMQLLERGGVRADETDSWGRTALFYAQDSSSSCAKILLERGCSADARDKNRQTALFAVPGPIVARLLIQAKATVDARDKDQRTALFAAARSGDDAKLKVLVQAGADGGLKDSQGQTALFEASRTDSVRAVRLLIQEAWADPLEKDFSGNTVLEAARKSRKRPSSSAKPLTGGGPGRPRRSLGGGAGGAPPGDEVFEYLKKVAKRTAETNLSSDSRRVYRLVVDHPDNPDIPEASADFGASTYEAAVRQLAELGLEQWLHPELWGAPVVVAPQGSSPPPAAAAPPVTAAASPVTAAAPLPGGPALTALLLGGDAASPERQAWAMALAAEGEGPLPLGGEE